jgi:hypothetical protein
MLADPVTRAALASLGGDAETHDDQDAPGEVLRRLGAKRQRLIDLYTDGDIDRGEFRSRRDAIDDDIREVETQIGQRQGNRVLYGIPETYDELVHEWERRGIDFQRRLTALLLEPINVQPAGAKRRTFDPDRLEIVPRA